MEITKRLLSETSLAPSFREPPPPEKPTPAVRQKLSPEYTPELPTGYVPELDDLINPDEAAKMIDCKPGYLERLRYFGKGPPYLKAHSGERSAVKYTRRIILIWMRQNLWSSTTEHATSGAVAPPTPAKPKSPRLKLQAKKRGRPPRRPPSHRPSDEREASDVPPPAE